MTLWKWLGVSMPSLERESSTNSDPGEYMLVWGGSTITGQFAIQIAAQSGFRVIAVTSEKTRDLVLGLGATHVVTRTSKTDEEISEEIAALGGDCITRGLDLVGPKTATRCLKLLSTSLPATFVPLAMMSATEIVPDHIAVPTVEMKQFVLDRSSSIYSEQLNSLIESGNLRLPQIDILKGGLGVIEEGLQRVKKGDMEGRKLVVSMSS
jgi:NADPH:quinone reductase-like Zn-dependent oxidoreductase